MPIYEYECLDQKHRFEVIQKYSDPNVSHCTVCGGTVQRLLSSPAIQFKGTGWYITDYARKDSGSGGSDTKSSSNDKPASSDAAKPAAEASTSSNAGSSSGTSTSSSDTKTSSSDKS